VILDSCRDKPSLGLMQRSHYTAGSRRR
jgi:hypothetical protein